jgi:hypothetical protein
MARALSPVYSIIRGSVAGLTYLSNQYHQIVVRARTAPVQPGTPLQSAIKTAFSGAESAWLNESDGIRTNWQLYADGTSYKGPIGDYTVPGRLMYTAVQGLRNFINSLYGAALPANSAAPTTPGWHTLSNVHSVPPGGVGTGIGVSFGTPLGLQATKVYYEISPAFNPTRNRYKGPWNTGQSNVTASIPAGTTGIISILNLVVGLVYFVRIRAITATGPYRISIETIVRCVAVTVV